MNCKIHDCLSAICSSCKHRMYIYPRDKPEVSPEQLLMSEITVSCDYCGRQAVSVDRVTAWCNCFHCSNARELKQRTGERINAPLECECK